MTGFDWIVLVGLPVVAVIGYRIGFLVAASSFGGFVIGVLLGLAAAPTVVDQLPPGPLRALLGLGLVLGIGVLCQAAGSYLGGAVRESVHGPRAQRVDAAVGGVASVVALLGFAWVIGSAAQEAGDVPFASSVRDSRLVSVLSETVPLDSAALLATFGTLVDRSGFPAVFSDTGMERIDPVPPPDASVLAVPGVREAAPSVVKILGSAPACHRSLEGSGFVVAGERVLTNAHVVAGTDEVSVYRSDSARAYPATVVAFDPRTDVAVLDVPDLDAPALRAGPELSRGDQGVVVGYPGDGPLLATAARVRGHVRAIGEDIYGSGSVEREVYALRTQVRSGNSGGPLLDTEGRWVGLVFAASVDDPSTGYALRPSAVADTIAAGRTAQQPVSTQSCTS